MAALGNVCRVSSGGCHCTADSRCCELLLHNSETALEAAAKNTLPAAFSSSAPNVHEAFPAGTKFHQVTSTVFRKFRSLLCVFHLHVLPGSSTVGGGLVRAHLTESLPITVTLVLKAVLHLSSTK